MDTRSFKFLADKEKLGLIKLRIFPHFKKDPECDIFQTSFQNWNKRWIEGKILGIQKISKFKFSRQPSLDHLYPTKLTIDHGFGWWFEALAQIKICLGFESLLVVVIWGHIEP